MTKMAECKRSMMRTLDALEGFNRGRPMARPVLVYYSYRHDLGEDSTNALDPAGCLINQKTWRGWEQRRSSPVMLATLLQQVTA